MKVEIGGKRLGSGGKMMTNMHGFNRSTHQIGYAWRSSMAPGTLVPFLCEPILNGDTFDIDLNTLIRTLPTNGPIFGSFKLQLDVFSCPIRLYNAQLHNNALNIGMNMKQVKFPIMWLGGPNPDLTQNDLNSQQINPSALVHYLGISGLGMTRGASANNYVQRSFNAMPVLMVWDIYKNYYANKQEGVGYVVSPNIKSITATITSSWFYNAIGNKTDIPDGPYTFQPGTTYVIEGTNLVKGTIMLRKYNEPDAGNTKTAEDWGFTIQYELNGTIAYMTTKETFTANSYTDEDPTVVGAGTAITAANGIELKKFPLENIDKMRESILQQPKENALAITNATSFEPYKTVVGYTSVNGVNTYNNQFEMNGLPIKTYQSDRFNNWLSSEWIDGANGIAALSAVDTSSGKFTMDQLNLAQKVYDLYNRIAVKGGSYNDWQEAVWGENTTRQAESPMYMGGLSAEIIFNEVVSTADASGGGTEQPLGTLAGKGRENDEKGGTIRIKANEPSFVIGLVSITPRIDYSQGNKWWNRWTNMDELHKPSLDGIGFQDLITEEMAAFDTTLDAVGNPTYYTAGKQPAWIEYMTNQNEVHGNFALPNSEMFMTLNRRYTHDPLTGRIKDLTTYIDPSKYNYAFAVQELKAQNFWTQIGVSIVARRKMSAKIIPNL